MVMQPPAKQTPVREEKPTKGRLVDRLMELMENPEKYGVVKAEVSYYFSKRGDHHHR